MRPVRVILIVLGCALIILNMWKMTDAEAMAAPRTSDIVQLLGIYISRLYLLLAGIICLSLSSRFQGKGTKVKQIA